jgi:16S rRNA (guanine527-N7)-methyltransferase
VCPPADVSPADLEALFARTLPALGLPATGPLSGQLARFVALLHKWNQAFNLTGVRDPREMAIRHVLDSLSARPFLAGGRVADVGCGAGLPGIPLALAEPGRQFTLLDSGFKKIRFVRQAVAELGIPNVTAEHRRVEDFHPAVPFDTVTCRAFTSLADFVEGSGHLAGTGGRLLALKGRHPRDELSALPPDWRATVTAVTVPELAAERHMVVLERVVPERAAGEASP